MSRDLARVMREAFYIARTGRPGPVLVDIAKDAQQAVDRVGIRRHADPPARLPARPAPAAKGYAAGASR